jgi:hypothetical protein
MTRESTLNRLFPSLIIIILLSISSFAFYFQFLCVKKYFPKMTIWEYLILEDKIRVVSDRNE